MTEQICEALQRIERRLIVLEEKVDRIQTVPRAVKLPVAAKLLGCDVTTLKRDVRRKRLRTIRIGAREHVPMSEIVRLCATPTTPPPSPPTIPPTAKRLRAAAAGASDVFRALARRR